MVSPLPRLLSLLLLLFVAVPQGSATTVVPPDFQTLIEEADTILIGDVESVTSRWTMKGSSRIITSTVSLNVLEVLKGTAGETYQLEMAGGRVGDAVQQIADFRPYRKGERVLLFISGNGTNLIPVVRLKHGSFEVTKNSDGTEAVLKHDGRALQSIDEIGKEKVANEKARKALRRNEFVRQIREKINTGAAQSPAP